LKARFWQVRFAAGLLHLAVGLVLCAWVVVTNISPPDDGGALSVPLCGGIGLLVALAGVGFINAARRGRARKRARLVALSGDRAAIPEALVRTHPERAPDAAGLPLVLAWRMRPSARFSRLTGLLIVLVTVALVLVVEGNLLGPALLNVAQAALAAPPSAQLGLLLGPLVTLGLGALLLGDLLASSISTLRLWHPAVFGGTIRITASDTGVRYERPWRRRG
jgi:hypothetical protein